MTKEGKFVYVADIDELKEKVGKQVFAGDDEVALFKVNGKIYALGNVCPHQHASIVFQGFIEENCVVCPAHGWEFDLGTGKRKFGNKGLETYEVLLEGKKIFVHTKTKNSLW